MTGRMYFYESTRSRKADLNDLLSDSEKKTGHLWGSLVSMSKHRTRQREMRFSKIGLHSITGKNIAILYFIYINFNNINNITYFIFYHLYIALNIIL